MRFTLETSRIRVYSPEVELESFPFSTHSAAARAASGTGIACWSVGHRTARTRRHIPKRGGRAADEQSDTLSTHATDALRTGVAFIQNPRAFATGTIDLDLSVAV